MPTSQPVTETIILHLKEGVNLENIASATNINGSSPTVQTFIQLTEVVKAQDGFICQYWGHQVEDPRIFVWSIDWKSFEYTTSFVSSKQYSSFMVGMGQVFNLGVAEPLTMFTRFNTDASAAFAAPVTEVAFFTVPDGARDEAKATMEETLSPSLKAVVTVGRAWGGATGWVFDTKNTGDAVPDGESIAVHGVFGYATVEDHIRWRQTPEHAQVIKDIGESPMGKLGLKDPKMPGGNIFLPDSSMFHVKFRAGI